MVIAMFYNDNAPPHFHVRYGGQKAVIGIPAGGNIGGQTFSQSKRPVLEWATLHQGDLMADWELARRQAPLNKIEPLE